MQPVVTQNRSMKIKKGDTVIVVTGSDRNRQGVVKSVAANGRVVVEGVALKSHYVRPNPESGVEGGIIRKEAAIQQSNVAILNPATGKRDKVGFRHVTDAAGQIKKVRVFKSTGEVIDL